MRRTYGFAIGFVWVLCLSVLGCDSQCACDPYPGNADGGVDASTGVLRLADLPGRRLVMRVDRRWDATGEAADPSAELLERDYRPVDDPEEHGVEISADGTTIAIEATPALRGTRASATDERLEYTLDTAFAGGRFVIWDDADREELSAELTVYGSGVPIASSVRGVLYESR